MHLKINKSIIYIAIITALLLLAAFFKHAMTGYSFTVLILLACAAVVAVFFILSLKITKLFKRLKMTLIILLSIFAACMIVAEIPVIATMNKREKAVSPYCIVLGAGVNGNTPSRILSQRINATYEFLTEYPDTIAVLSGGKGSGENISEAQCMKENLVSMGIAPERLLLEDKSTSTKENIEFSKAVIQSVSPETTSVTIITSDFHLYRGCMIAKKFGFEAEGYYAHTDLPVMKLSYMIRDGLAVWKDWLF